MPHTPGPWHSGHNDQPEPEFIVSETNNGSAAICYVRKPEDARLIAAAPDLLAACEFAIDAYDSAHHVGKAHWSGAQVDLMRAAITKAKGS